MTQSFIVGDLIKFDPSYNYRQIPSYHFTRSEVTFSKVWKVLEVFPDGSLKRIKLVNKHINDYGSELGQEFTYSYKSIYSEYEDRFIRLGYKPRPKLGKNKPHKLTKIFA